MRIHDLLFELLMGPKLSMKHGHPISFNCTFTLYKKSKSNSLLKVNKYNVSEIKQSQNKLWRSLFLRRGADSAAWAGLEPPSLAAASGHPSQPTSWLLQQGHPFPIESWGGIPFCPVQLGSGFCVVPEQCKRIDMNQRICPTILSVRKIYCQKNGM